ncbi:hypothetical protein [Fimbriiglobus ruber]|uniref:Uncharacterized protein n=1 Tax=Fimbriiglobus ruber TaxID=1908690 RepID=A0A225DN85_9BACT|nr:hypothetical protein [Fimbriiglobus ruber]OWK42930.1 hypothetical protein FRUB_02527 [Fimbriiglobus ruber]
MNGTVKNGVIVPDESLSLPEGARVRFEVEEVFEYPHPMATYDREKELTVLRESIEDLRAGHGSGAREFLKQLAIERGLPLEPGE